MDLRLWLGLWLWLSLRLGLGLDLLRLLKLNLLRLGLDLLLLSWYLSLPRNRIRRGALWAIRHPSISRRRVPLRQPLTLTLPKPLLRGRGTIRLRLLLSRWRDVKPSSLRLLRWQAIPGIRSRVRCGVRSYRRREGSVLRLRAGTRLLVEPAPAVRLWTGLGGAVRTASASSRVWWVLGTVRCRLVVD